MRAMMSNPDSGVSALRPDLYPADLAWLSNQAEREARAILAHTEPESVLAYTEPWGSAQRHSESSPWSSLAEALAAFVAEGE